MKINDVSGQAQAPKLAEEQFFSIQDQGMIFDILRNKMYSNPILAICREITCNARDAHREVGKADVPIQIFLPISGEPYFKVKDFGPGISPDRISNIFIKYTASTKRSDNIQTGGFGLGAKTPFSYSDTFNIKTNHNGKQYNYTCFIDDTKVGKIVLLDEADTTEPNGTEIIVPVQSKDFYYFSESTEFATRHWDVKPIIKGATIKYSESDKILLSGSSWKISSTNEYNRSVKLIIDGIEYPLDLLPLKGTSEAYKMMSNCRGNLLLYFGVGELSLSANREQIYLDAPTKQKLSTKFTEMTHEVKSIIENKIKECESLREAIIFCRNRLLAAFTDISFIGNLQWNGYSINPSTRSFDAGCTVYTFRKGYSYRSTSPRISRSMAQGIYFEENSDLYINDLNIKDPVVKHIKKAFDDNPNLASLQLISTNDQAVLGSMDERFHLKQMKPKMISSITKYSARNIKSSANRLIVYHYNGAFQDFRQTSYDSIENDNNKKILCLFNNENSVTKEFRINDGDFVPPNVFKILSKNFPEHSFYAINSSIPQSRIDEDFSDFESFENFINCQVLTKTRQEYALLIRKKEFAESHAEFIEYSKCLTDLVRDPNSIFLKIHQKYSDMKNMSSNDLMQLKIYQNIGESFSHEEIYSDSFESDFKLLEEEYEKTYPLLTYIPEHKYGSLQTQISEYINLVDAKNLSK